MGTIAAFAVNFYYKDTAPGPYRYREVSTPIHREGAPLRSGADPATPIPPSRVAGSKFRGRFLAHIEILCVQFLHAEFFLRS
jgi:hypothetical protein